MKIVAALLCCFLLNAHASHSISYEALKKTAIKDGKFLWVFIETEGCFYCQKMRKELIDSKLFEKELSRAYVFVPIGERQAQDLHLDIQFFPTSYIINPKTNSIEEQFLGYSEPGDFIKILHYIHPNPKK